jgi:starch synthase
LPPPMNERARPLPRVLLIAEACNPGWSSVPLVGWHSSQAIASLTTAHLVTHVRNRENLARTGLAEGDSLTTLDTQTIEGPLMSIARLLGAGIQTSKGWTTLTALSTLAYYRFEQLVWRRFAPRLRRGEFDLVHRLTPLSPAIPSILARRCRRIGVPFVIGPLNGGLPWPRGFSRVRFAEGEWLGFIRGARRLLPSYASTRRDAAAIIVGSGRAWQEIPERHRWKSVYIPENGIDPEEFERLPAEPVAPPLRVAFAGRLVPTKGVDMLIEATAPLARAGQVQLELIGDGPEAQALRCLAERLGVSSALHVTGWVESARVRELLSRCHVLGFPSIRDFGGGAVLEAMALGLVPIVVDAG